MGKEQHIKCSNDIKYHLALYCDWTLGNIPRYAERTVGGALGDTQVAVDCLCCQRFSLSAQQKGLHLCLLHLR